MTPAVRPALATATATSAPTIRAFGFFFLAGGPPGPPNPAGVLDCTIGVHCVTGSADEAVEWSRTVIVFRSPRLVVRYEGD
jgi:hypothetical protein